MKGLEFLNDYRKLAPIFMGVLLVGSIYGRVNAAREDATTYQDHINAAREYREGKIYATAKEEYEKALDMDESLDLYCEIEEMLEEEGNSDKIETWCEKIIDKYPNEPVGYEYLISCYKSIKDYVGCFKQYEIVTKRGITSENIESEIASIKYEYNIDGFQFETISDFINGYAVATRDDKKGLISEKGDTIIGFKFADMSGTDGNYVAAIDDNNEAYYMDLNGDRRLNFPDEIEITKIGKISGDIIPVYTRANVYYYTATDRLQLLGPYEDGYAFSNGVAAVLEGGQWYLIDTEGNKLTDGYEGFCVNTSGGVVSNDRIFANKGNGYVMLNESLQQVNSTVYEDVRFFADNPDDSENFVTYAAVKKDGKWGFVDKDGNFIIKPKYDDAYSFCNGLAPVKENDLWGYIDESGRWAVTPIFKDARGLNSSGCGFVKEDGDIKWNLIRFTEFNY